MHHSDHTVGSLSGQPQKGQALPPLRWSRWVPALVLFALTSGLLSAQTSTTGLGQPTTTWLGQADSDWFNPSNWTFGVPTPIQNAELQAGTPFSPVIIGSAVCFDCNLHFGQSLTIPCSPPGHLTVHGDLTINGTLVNCGGITIAGSSIVNAGMPITGPFAINPVTSGAVIDLNAPMTLDAISLLGGTLRTTGVGTATVLFGGVFTAGSLVGISSTFTFNGPVLFGGTDVNAMPDLRVAADWQSDAGFTPTNNALITFAGVSNVNESGSVFPRLSCAPGSTVNVIDGAIAVRRNVTLDGSAFSGTIETIGTAPSTVTVGGFAPSLRVLKTGGATTYLSGPQTWNSHLEIGTGNLQLTDGGTKTFLGNCMGFSGALLAGDGDLSIRGNVSMTGTDVTAMPSIHVGGGLNVNASFQPQSGTVTLDGTGTQLITSSGATVRDLVVAAGSTAGFSTPTTVLGNLLVEGHTVGAALTISGDVHSVGSADPAQSWILGGAGDALVSGTGVLPTVAVITTGTKDLAAGLTIGGDLQLLGGSLRTVGGGTRTVLGASDFSAGFLVDAGGSLTFDGPVTFNGANAEDMPALIVNHDWTSGASFNLSGDQQIFFNGQGRTVNGLGSTFPHVHFGSGSDISLPAPLHVARNLVCDGVDLNGLIVCNGGHDATIVVSGVADSLHVNKAPGISCGMSGHQVWTGSLEVSSGILQSILGGTKTFLGDITFQGGLLANNHGDFRCLGNVNFNGGDATSMFDLGVGGDWVSDASFQPQIGRVTFEGSGLQLITATGSSFASLDVALGANVNFLTPLAVKGDFSNRGSVGGSPLSVGGDIRQEGTAAGHQWRMVGTLPGSCSATSAIPHLLIDAIAPKTLIPDASGSVLQIGQLDVSQGTLQLSSDLEVEAQGALVLAGQTMNIGGANLALTAGIFDVQGTLRIGPDGKLALGAASSLNTLSGSTLILDGSPGAPARVCGANGGGYACSLQGHIAAGHFAFEQMGAAGIRIGPSASFAAAPEDFRHGFFDRGASAAGSVLLDLEKPGSFVFRHLSFLNSTGSASFNVRASGGAQLSLLDWSGSFGGEPFEDDPGDTIAWPDGSLTDLDFFTLTPGAEKARVRFATTDETGVAAYRVERSTSFGGAYSIVAMFASAGSGLYEFLDTGLTANQIYFYRLVEIANSGGETELASESVLPFAADLPANVSSVGPAGIFADIQSAVDAATQVNSVIRVAAGTYPAFVIGTSAPASLRIEADGSGPVVIDTASSPLRIENRSPIEGVELLGLEIGSPENTGPALVFVNSDATTLVHDCRLRGGAAMTCLLDDSRNVAFQRCDASGGALVLDQGSIAMLSASDVGLLDLRAGSELVTCEITSGGQVVDADCTLTQLAGLMPRLEGPTSAVSGEVVTLTIEDQPLADWFLFRSFKLAWFRPPTPFVEMTGLGGDLGAPQLIALGMTDATGVSPLSLNYPLDQALHGHVASLQYLVHDPASGHYRFSEISRILLLP